MKVAKERVGNNEEGSRVAEERERVVGKIERVAEERTNQREWWQG